MELMSSLLLCALAALLPQTLGRSEFNNQLEIKKSHKGNKMSSRSILLNMKTPLVGENTDLHSVYDDVTCRQCNSCMDRAIKAYNTFIEFSKNRPSAQDLHEDLLRNQIIDNNRHKRDVHKTNAATKDLAKVKSKPRNNKRSKSAAVTKYDYNGKIYALQVKELNDSNLKEAKCELYSVKKSLPCESPESEGLLAEARRNSKKVNKIDKTQLTAKIPTNKSITTKITTTTTPRVRVAIFRKREADNSDAPDFMPSIEEMAY